MEAKRQPKSGTPSGLRDALKKATTEMLVLTLLKEKPMYTYEMMTTIETRSGGAITFNTLYQSIYRLENFKYIREHGKLLSEDNRVRIYFTITDEGKAYLEQLIPEYLAFTGAVDQLLGLKQEVPLQWNSSAG